MTASDYTDFALYQQRERELTIRNERRRLSLERQGESSTLGIPRLAVKRSLRTRISMLIARVPVRG
jgi:hypothetical protein